MPRGYFIKIIHIETKYLIICYNEFIKLGITPSLYEHDRPTNIEFFNNLHNSYNDTEAFIEALVEAEDAAECGDDEE